MKRIRIPALLLALCMLSPAMGSCSPRTAPEQTDAPPAESIPEPQGTEEELPLSDETEPDAPAEEPEPAAPETEAPEDNPEPEPVPEPVLEEPVSLPEEPASSSEEPENALSRLSYADPERYSLYLEEAVEYARTIHDLYWDGENGISKLTPSGGTPHLWPFTEQAGMVNGILAAMDADHPDRAFFEQYLRELIEGLRHYRVKRVKLTGNETWNDPDNFIAPFGENDGTPHAYALYASSRHDKKIDYLIVTPDAVYFDDNVWVAKEFYFAYVNTGDLTYLNEAVNIMNWILGEGYEDAGELAGIYWKWSAKFKFDGGNYSDSNHASLNACSTASSAMVLAKLCGVLADTPLEGLRDGYLEKALAIYDFCGKAYVDPSTKCLYDKVFLKQNFASQTALKQQLQKTDTAQYAYNTGTYLTAGADLYALLYGTDPARAEEILKSALASAKGADKKFADRTAKKGEYSYPSHSWFTSFLVSGFADLAAFDGSIAEYTDHMRSALDYAWTNNRSADGLVCPAWIKGWSHFSDNGANSEGNPRQILYQSANAHCYAMMAEYYR